MHFGIRGVLALNTLCAAIVGTGSRDTRVLVWDVETAAVVQTLEGHKYQVWPKATWPSISNQLCDLAASRCAASAGSYIQPT